MKMLNLKDQNLKTIDPSYLQILDGYSPSGNSLALAVLKMYLESAPKNLEKLRQSLAESDYEQLAIAAHSLKSSSANIGSLKVTSLSAEIEKFARQSKTATEPLSSLNELVTALEAAFAATLEEVEQLLSTADKDK